MQCQNKWMCPTCHKRRFRQKIYDCIHKLYRLQSDEEMELGHDCESYYCKECKEEVKNSHRCFIQRKEYKDKIQKLLFFDVETDQSTKTHEKSARQK